MWNLRASEFPEPPKYGLKKQPWVTSKNELRVSWRLWFLSTGGRNRWTWSQLYPSPDIWNWSKEASHNKRHILRLVMPTQDYLTHFGNFPSQNGHHITFNERACRICLRVSWTSKATLGDLKDKHLEGYDSCRWRNYWVSPLYASPNALNRFKTYWIPQCRTQIEITYLHMSYLHKTIPPQNANHITFNEIGCDICLRVSFLNLQKTGLSRNWLHCFTKVFCQQNV